MLRMELPGPILLRPGSTCLYKTRRNHCSALICIAHQIPLIHIVPHLSNRIKKSSLPLYPIKPFRKFDWVSIVIPNRGKNCRVKMRKVYILLGPPHLGHLRSQRFKCADQQSVFEKYLINVPVSLGRLDILFFSKQCDMRSFVICHFYVLIYSHLPKAPATACPPLQVYPFENGRLALPIGSVRFQRTSPCGLPAFGSHVPRPPLINKRHVYSFPPVLLQFDRTRPVSPGDH